MPAAPSTALIQPAQPARPEAGPRGAWGDFPSAKSFPSLWQQRRPPDIPGNHRGLQAELDRSATSPPCKMLPGMGEPRATRNLLGATARSIPTPPGKRRRGNGHKLQKGKF